MFILIRKPLKFKVFRYPLLYFFWNAGYKGRIAKHRMNGEVSNTLEKNGINEVLYYMKCPNILIELKYFLKK